jgi:2-C-methyl-D-erythritol 4-phosphate cytidylyltransferase
MRSAGARKPLMALGGRPVLEHALAPFAASAWIREIVLVGHPDDRSALEDLVSGSPHGSKVTQIVDGGAERSISVRRGCAAVDPRAALISVHDAARPLLALELLERALACAALTGAALVALPARDTIKRSRSGSSADETLERAELWQAQTPQTFRADTFRELLARAAEEGWIPTDDSALWERYVGPVALIEGDPRNFKVTTPADLELAEAWLALRGKEEPA